MEEDGFPLGAACRTVYELICAGFDTNTALAQASGMKEAGVRGRTCQLAKRKLIIRYMGEDERVHYKPIKVHKTTKDGESITLFNADIMTALDAIDRGEPFDSMRVAHVTVPGRYLEMLEVGVAGTSIDTEDAVLIISDLHVGVKTTIVNKDKWESIFKTLQESVLRLLGHVLGGVEIETLHIFLLGDVVTGETLFPAQAFRIDMTMMEQLGVFVRNMGAFLESLQAAFLGNIEVHCVDGNHGRVSRFSAEETNWDHLAYEMLKLSVAEHKKITIDIADEFYKLVEIKGHRYMLTHGDSIISYQNIPLYGAIQAMMRWQMSAEPHDVLCLGHFHTSNMMQWNDCTVIMNGTTSIGDEWLQKNLKMKADPHFWLFGVSEKRPITWQYRVDVDCRQNENIGKDEKCPKTQTESADRN